MDLSLGYGLPTGEYGDRGPGQQVVAMTASLPFDAFAWRTTRRYSG
jgi:hypothetical protein